MSGWVQIADRPELWGKDLDFQVIDADSLCQWLEGLSSHTFAFEHTFDFFGGQFLLCNCTEDDLQSFGTSPRLDWYRNWLEDPWKNPIDLEIVLQGCVFDKKLKPGKYLVLNHG